MNRRDFLQALLVAGEATLAAPLFSSVLSKGTGMGGDESPWETVPKILQQIKAPVLPLREFDITKYGAVSGGKDTTEAFRSAIAACTAAGGGRVVVPPGEFLTGAVHLKSNVNLHVASGGLIRFSSDPEKYPLVLTRFEGVELMNYSPFIYALDQENIAITGEGTIDGGAGSSHWWDWKSKTQSGSNSPNDRDLLFQLAERNVPVAQRVFGPGHYLRPQLLQPYRCKNVLIEGVTLLNSPMWNVHPVLCSNVTVRKLTLNSSGPNTDGCDPESCSNVLIDDCSFSTGDDCIAVKSGRNADGRRLGVPSQNIVVRNCRMKNGHGGVSVGSEITGGVSNVFVENCTMDSPTLDMAFRVKNNAMRGGLLHDLHLRDIRVGQVAHSAISIDFFYEEGQTGAFTPVARDISVNNLSTHKAEYALYLRGFEKMPIENVAIVNCNFQGIGRPNVIEHVKGLSLRNVYINGKLADRPA